MRSTARAVFDYLNDPELVWKFQQFFGVRKLPPVEQVEEETLLSRRKIYPTPVKSLDGENEYIEGVYHPSGYNLRSRSHQRTSSDTSTCSTDSQSSQTPPDDYYVTSKFFYYLFSIGAGLGNEMFYCLFFPYWFWNVDGYVCRRLVLTWMLIMYIGQALKDIIRLPRPPPPVVRMEKRYELEYGMPSTHAMIGLAFPAAFLYFTINRYEYNGNVGIFLGVIWCLCVCTSRLYLGMHSVADVIAGLTLSTVLMTFIIPALGYIDRFQLESPYSPIVMIVLTLIAALMYPSLDEWSTCRGDTVLILGLPSWSTCRGDTVATLGVSCGVSIASWYNYQNNFIPHDSAYLVGSPPYHVKTPDLEWMSLAILRMVIGLSCLFITRATMKKLTYYLSCWIFRLNTEEYSKNKRLLIVELPYKYFTYCAISLNVVYLSPLIFRYFDIERPTAWTEV